MPREVTLAGSKTTTQVARSYKGSDPKRLTFVYKTIYTYLETQETPRVIIALVETAAPSAAQYTSHSGRNVKLHVSRKLIVLILYTLNSGF